MEKYATTTYFIFEFCINFLFGAQSIAVCVWNKRKIVTKKTETRLRLCVPKSVPVSVPVHVGRMRYIYSCTTPRINDNDKTRRRKKIIIFYLCFCDCCWLFGWLIASVILYYAVKELESDSAVCNYLIDVVVVVIVAVCRFLHTFLRFSYFRFSFDSRAQWSVRAKKEWIKTVMLHLNLKM